MKISKQWKIIIKLAGQWIGYYPILQGAYIDSSPLNITSSNLNVVPIGRDFTKSGEPYLVLYLHNVGLSVITFREPATGTVLKRFTVNVTL